MSNTWRDSVPVVYITQAQVDENLQCTICLEDFKCSEEVRRLDCSHVYHDICIGPWFNQHNVCPMCRRMTVSGGEVNSESEMTSDFDDEDEDDMEINVVSAVTDSDDDDAMSMLSFESPFLSDENDSFVEESPVSDEERSVSMSSSSSDLWVEFSDQSAADCAYSEEEEEETNSQPAPNQSNGSLNVTIEMDEAEPSNSENSNDETWISENGYSEPESIATDSD